MSLVRAQSSAPLLKQIKGNKIMTVRDPYDVEYSGSTKEKILKNKDIAVANSLADTFLCLSKLKDSCPEHTAIIDITEKNVRVISKELCRVKDELSKLKGEL
jgi:hypothetical protein